MMTFSATVSRPMLKSAILATFQDLLDAAAKAGEPEPTAMCLATTDGAGRVSARMVLLKGVDTRGFRFFSHHDSDKGLQLAAHPQAALCFHWQQLGRGVQVRVEGRVEKLDAEASDAYFATRPRPSQLGAWASRQSRELPSRELFEQRLAAYGEQFEGVEVARPPHWGGYLLVPDLVEFWHGAEFRLHDRERWTRDADGEWHLRQLYP
ncbi:pyridoxamine 5'-phosphate oxidase [Frateuria aurantia]